MQNDDEPIGHIITRRELIVLLGAAGASMLTACSSDANGSIADPLQCVARPQQTEGPYFVDERLNRSDIRSDPSDGSVKTGVPLALSFLVSRLSGSTCTPLASTFVDVWHCDALGAYAGVAGSSTAGKKFLRGYQVTDANGRADFSTIYPGWYQGRTVHVHFKIRTSLTGSSYEFTSQLYFPDSLTDTVFTQQPYATRGTRSTRNANDGIFGSGGSQLLVAPTQSGNGYATTFHIGLQI